LRGGAPRAAGTIPDLLGVFEIWEHEPTAADLDGFAASVEATDRFS
jgi:hypothetical protein